MAATPPGKINDKILLYRYRVEGDLDAREQLIERYMPLVRALARRYSARGEPFDDLAQIGSIGLIKAIDRFDITRGVELTTYATPNIIGEIKRYFRDHGWSVRVPRGLQELSAQVNRQLDRMTSELGRSPTIAEVAKKLEVSEERVIEAIESGRAYNSLSLSQGTLLDGDDEVDPMEAVGTADHEYEISEDRLLLEPGIRSLDDREQRIIKLRFFDGLTQSEIAREVGISQMHVSRLIRRSLDKIRLEIMDQTRAELAELDQLSAQRRAERNSGLAAT